MYKFDIRSRCFVLGSYISVMVLQSIIFCLSPHFLLSSPLSVCVCLFLRTLDVPTTHTQRSQGFQEWQRYFLEN